MKVSPQNKWVDCIKDVPGGIPKSDLLGVTLARIHVAGQWLLAV